MKKTATQWAVGARSANDVRTAAKKNRYAAQNPKADPVKDKRSTTERRDSVVLADYYSDEAYHAYNGKGAEEVTAMDQANRLRQAGLVESRTYTKEAMKSGEDRNRRRSVVLSVGVRKNMWRTVWKSVRKSVSWMTAPLALPWIPISAIFGLFGWFSAVLLKMSFF